MMRHLVACSDCNRQYDATGREPGDRFRCLCGAEFEVPAPRPHTASVIRCSSCGATRMHDASACSHCGSDFTLHERDLHTICPGCMARVSDRASYCHHCATRLDPQGDAGDVTASICPACDDNRRLSSRNFGVEGLSILECPGCAGIWLSHGAFRHLVERAEASPGTAKVHAAAARASAAKTAQPNRLEIPERLYRPCVECGQLMHRRNYDHRSGVIIDVCNGHGVWFDPDELAAILRWIREGGARLARETEAERLADRERRAKPITVPGAFPPMSRPVGGPEPATLLEFLLEAAIFLFRLAR